MISHNSLPLGMSPKSCKEKQRALPQVDKGNAHDDPPAPLPELGVADPVEHAPRSLRTRDREHDGHDRDQWRQLVTARRQHGAEVDKLERMAERLHRGLRSEE